MKKVLLWGFLVLVMGLPTPHSASAAEADNYWQCVATASGTSPSWCPDSLVYPMPVQTVPYGFTPLSPGQHGIAPTSATTLTIPVGTIYATVCASTALVLYTTDGTTTPTGTVGQPLTAGTCVALSGAKVVSNFKAFSATGTLDVEYFK